MAGMVLRHFPLFVAAEEVSKIIYPSLSHVAKRLYRMMTATAVHDAIIIETLGACGEKRRKDQKKPEIHIGHAVKTRDYPTEEKAYLLYKRTGSTGPNYPYSALINAGLFPKTRMCTYCSSHYLATLT
jgi:hypothetical protein